MCSECGYTTCHPMCPNAEPPKAVYCCDYCGDDIVEGDECFSIFNDYHFHLNCAADTAIPFLVEHDNATTGVAGNKHHKCKACDEVIECDDKYFCTCVNEYYHLECALDTSLKLFIDHYGDCSETAEAEDYDWECDD